MNLTTLKRTCKSPNYKAVQIKFYDHFVFFTKDLPHSSNVAQRTLLSRSFRVALILLTYIYVNNIYMNIYIYIFI